MFMQTLQHCNIWTMILSNMAVLEVIVEDTLKAKYLGR